MDELEQEMTPLCHLARKYGTDKGGNHLKAGDTVHRYTPAYHKLLKDKREQVKYALEIGVAGGASLRMWEEYFPNAHIIGLDHDMRCLYTAGRIRSYYADQSDANGLDMALAVVGDSKFDLIVDDGSHEPLAQTLAANHLQKYLHPNGFYVIEDIAFDCSPQLHLKPLTWGNWVAVPTGVGLGRAHCECGCGAGEVLLVGHRGGQS